MCFQASEMLKHLVEMIGSAALDEKTLNDPSVIKTSNTFSFLSLESLKQIFASVEGDETLKYVR